MLKILLKKMSLTFILSIIVIAVAIVAGLYIINLLRPVNETRTRMDSSTLESRIELIAELATLNYIYRNVGVFERYATGGLFGAEWRWPFTTRSFIIRYEGEVRFGIDADRIAFDVDNEINRITVSLPSVRILTHVVFEDTVEVMDEFTGLFARTSIADYPEFIAHEKQSLEEWLVANGILEQARESAERAVRGLIEAMVEQLDTDYEIVFR